MARVSHMYYVPRIDAECRMVCMARKLYASCEYFLSGDQFIMLGH